MYDGRSHPEEVWRGQDGGLAPRLRRRVPSLHRVRHISWVVFLIGVIWAALSHTAS
jgi:hypothetical protein